MTIPICPVTVNGVVYNRSTIIRSHRGRCFEFSLTQDVRNFDSKLGCDFKIETGETVINARLIGVKKYFELVCPHNAPADRAVWTRLYYVDMDIESDEKEDYQMTSLMEKFCVYCGKSAKIGCCCASQYPDLRKPHKCPVCEGTGEMFDKRSSGDSNELIIEHGWKTCNACKGEGIVWG
jgi:hypothetical protein